MALRNLWWWVAAIYGVVFPLLTLTLRIREGTGEALGFFLLLAILATLLSSITLFKSWKWTNGTLPSEMKARVAVVALSIALWMLNFSLPELK
jgi:hypothetical protein